MLKRERDVSDMLTDRVLSIHRRSLTGIVHELSQRQPSNK